MKRHNDSAPTGARELVVSPRLERGSGKTPAKPAEWAVKFKEFIDARPYPCVGAKSAIGKGQMTAYIANSLVSAWDDVALTRELIEFAKEYSASRTMFQTFVAIFPNTPTLDEPSFEDALWQRISSLQNKDEWLGQEYDPSVSPDPASPKFSLSFGGQSFFVVGMHPNASRPARRFQVAALVFNLHDQFNQLRESGQYEKMRETILSRDEDFAGSINPMVARHGESSEASQYSGRIVGPDWQCPWPGRK